MSFVEPPHTERGGSAAGFRPLGQHLAWQWVSAGLATAFLAGLLWFTWHRYDAESELQRSSVRAQQVSLVVILAENLTQLVDRGRFMSIAATEWFEGDRAKAAARLETMLGQDDLFVRASLFDGELRRVYASSPSTDAEQWGRLLARRLQEARGQPSQDVQLLEGADEVGGMWQVPLLFPVPNSAGQPHGWLLLMVDMGYFLRLYRNVDLGSGTLIHVMDAQGRLIAEANRVGLMDTSGMSRAFDGSELMYTLRPAERTPFQVAVSVPADELRSALLARQKRSWGMTALFSVLLIAASGALFKGLQRQHQFFHAIRRADEEKHELIEQLEREKARAIELASCDHLTGLHNRRMFTQLAVSHLEYAKRSRKHYALAYLDLDRFKLINDSLGHHVGDRLLCEVATRLRESVRSADVVGRMGGDEFAVLFTGLDKDEDIDGIASKLLEVLAEPYRNLDGHDVQTAASMGIAFFPRDGHDISTLSRYADAAMYQSKRAGRGRYSVYDVGISPTAERRNTLERQMPAALASDQFVLHYQPKLSLCDFRITGFEALLRWRHPDLGLVMPGDFIPLAEQSGLIVELGNWALAAACQQMAAWRAQGLQGFSVAVNVSPRQLRDPALVDFVAGLLHQHGLQPADLEIEITESCLVEPLEQALAVLNGLEALGVSIALDDFGSGFSSLSQIRDLPVQTLKIDRSFVDASRSGDDARVIVTSIITLAHNLGMQVVAEGVELKSQLVFLKTANCDHVQGYYISRPLPPDEATRLFEQPLMEEVVG